MLIALLALLLGGLLLYAGLKNKSVFGLLSGDASVPAKKTGA